MKENYKMDWSKAKNILIITFVFLNIFLAVILFNILNSENISASTIKDTVKALEDRGVSISEDDIMKYKNNMGKLVYKNFEFDRGLVLSNFLGGTHNIEDTKTNSEIISGGKKILFENGHSFTFENSEPDNINGGLDNEDIINKYLKQKFKGLKIPISDFKLDECKNGSEYIFRQKFKGFWVYKNEIIVTVVNGGITRVECRYRKVDYISKGKEIIPLYQVLIKNFTGINNIVVKNIDIGFMENEIEKDTKELGDIPVWRIVYIDKQQNEHIDKEMFFKAYNGEILE